MPDWSYRTLFRPLLFRLPPRTARDLTLGVMGSIARFPGGQWFINFLGHMRPDERLGQTLLGITFPSPVGLAGDLDVNATALPALARFGLGFVEVGPVTLQPIAATVERRAGLQALWYANPPPNPGVEAIRERLQRSGKLPVPLLVRVADASTASQLTAFADALVLTPACLDAIDEIRAIAPDKPLLLAITADCDADTADAMIEKTIHHGVGGVIVDAVVHADGGWRAGLPALVAVEQMVLHLRQRWDVQLAIFAGGVHEPEHALRLHQAGAELVQVSSGLVYSGPGLPKRVNDAWLHATHGGDVISPAERAPEMTWFWTLLMGLGMLIGGLLAVAIAATRVVLPYDEVFSGMSRDQLDHINPRLLAFMTHDRVALAGTMVTIGILYPLLSWFGIRCGLHWAKVTVLASAFAGFASFFLFLGFGYFDPFHAFVTVVLFQFLLLGLHGKIAMPQAAAANLLEDWRWRWCQWGQLFLIVHNFTLIAAGCMIAMVGATHVFVHEDLDFMDTTAEALRTANPRLLPLVAHDRASFGGMLIASGIGLLLPSLWGIRQGERWLWWTFLLAAVPAYAAGIGVHFAVGYTNLWHLLPAFGGAALFTLALALAYPYLCFRSVACKPAVSAAPASRSRRSVSEP